MRTVRRLNDKSSRRPRERGDPSPLALIVRQGNCPTALSITQGVWVPAFAGTTKRPPVTLRIVLPLEKMASALIERAQLQQEPLCYLRCRSGERRSCCEFDRAPIPPLT